MRISVFGFDHGKYDRRIVMKDIAHFVSKGYKVQYLYRASESKSFQVSNEALDNNVEFVAVPKVGSGLLSRKKFEDFSIQLAKSFNPDFFYLHGMFVTFPVSRLRDLQSSGKVIYDEHEYPPEPIAIENPYIKKVVEVIINMRDRLISPHVDQCYTQSLSIKNYMEKAGHNNVILKQNVSEADIIKPKPYSKRERNLIIAGAMTYERGPFKVLKMMEALLEKSKEFKLHLHVFFPDPNLEKKFRKYITTHNLEDHVLFFDLLEYKKLTKKISNSLLGVMAMPQGICKITYLSIPNRFYDTLVSGTPLLIDSISPDVHHEVITHKLGFSFDFENFDKSITTLLEFLTNEKKYNECLAPIEDYAKANSWEKVSKVLDDIFKI